MPTKQDYLKQAEEEILEVIKDNGRWELFKQQVELRWWLQDFVDDSKREAALESCGESRASLQHAYLEVSMEHVCDSCDYNPKRRRGTNKCRAKRKYECNFEDDSSPQHTDKTTPPEWLDDEQNLCPNLYLDFTK
ncbi:hypothetical protein HN832_03195 [archaeon]|jgi:hypothetical protein|nr:hypothetical protein [archaeon]MBT4373598.1 hypothetical protein [archaeon]MBT4532046.1 hypothetical protein [archaeon]MBT7001713.1 hypothetical protein [archaeon]MBT7282395.1 hypothetical protein [archaeon]